MVSKVKIPKLYRERELDILGNKVLIRGYRPIDHDYVVALISKQGQLPELIKKEDKIKGLMQGVFQKMAQSGKQPTEEEINKELLKNISVEDFDDLMAIKEEQERLQGELQVLSEALAQRGLKRFFYRNDPEFIQAERENRGTEYIDSLDPIEIDPDNMLLVATTMIELGSPVKPLPVDDKGK